jgi:hypothetical protein
MRLVVAPPLEQANFYIDVDDWQSYKRKSIFFPVGRHRNEWDFVVRTAALTLLTFAGLARVC